MVYSVAITLHRTRWQLSYPFLTYTFVNLRCVMKRVWYLPDKYPETRKDWSNSDWSTWLIIIWHDDGVIWWDDDMTYWSWWSLSCLGIRRNVVSVLLSNHFSTQEPNNHSTTVHFSTQTCPWSTATLYSLPMDWTPLLGLLPRGLGGTTHQDNR